MKLIVTVSEQDLATGAISQTPTASSPAAPRPPPEADPSGYFRQALA
ncbi:MAG: hypothetical protein LBU05_05995 [Bifidobacteriaceae bacterium]|nr:hypothetical protein [Bifidobacteriaceae bacterium]